LIDQHRGVIDGTSNQVGHDICLCFRRGANQQADVWRLCRSRVARRRLRDYLILAYVGQMRSGDRSHFESALAQVQVSRATALSDYIRNCCPLWAEARRQVDAITATNAGSGCRALREDASLRNRRAVKLAVKGGEQAVS
jgi:hypothetical protein